MSKKHNRRDFLKTLGIFGGVVHPCSPAAIILSSIASGVQNEALAQALNITNPRKYLSIVQTQGPARTVFDSFFTPYESNNMIYNPGTGTRYLPNMGRYDSVGYATVSRHGIEVPYMWKYDVPKSSGGSRPMSDLLINMLSLQGVTTGNAGHAASRALHYLPLGSKQSLGALSSDYSNSSLGAVTFTSANYKHKSIKSLPANVLNLFNGNYLTKLLSPFLSNLSVNDKALQAELSSSRGALKDALGALGEVLNPNSKTSKVSNKKAFELSQGAFDDIVPFWNERLPVYQDLINRVVQSSTEYEGFNDLPVGSVDTGSRGTNYNTGGAGVISNLSDLRSSVGPGASIPFMAERFVAAEYLLTKNVSSSVTIGLSSLRGLSGLGARNAHDFDEHFLGLMFSTLFNFYFFRSASACLLELFDQMKSSSIFDETVIEMSGEFNRNARIDGSGSDHGFNGKSITYFSGAFKNGPLVVGSLKNSTGNYAGMWGQGAVDPLLGRQLELPDMAATLAHLLRVPSPFNFNSPVVTLNESGQLTPLIGKTKIIV